MKKPLSAALVIIFLFTGLAFGETAGDRLKETGKSVREGLNQAAEETEKGLKKTRKDVNEAYDRATEKLQEKGEAAKEDLDKASKKTEKGITGAFKKIGRKINAAWERLLKALGAD